MLLGFDAAYTSEMRTWCKVGNIIGLAIAVGIAAVSGAQDMTHHQHPPSGTAVVVDTDMALDDVRAIYALLAEPGIDVRALATVEGSASVGRGTDNLVGMLEDAGMTAAPVLRGEALAGAQPPPWRGRVDGLRGATFAPPQGRVSVGPVAEGLGASSHGADYVALGPVTNLARLLAARPGALDDIGAVWLPAQVRGGDQLDAWNLEFDAEATRAVFAAGRPTVVVNVAPGETLDTVRILQQLSGDSPALRWIHRSLSGESGTTPHWLIYDELVAVALARPDLIRMRPQRYALTGAGADTFRLVEVGDGPVQVAEITDLDAAMAHLADRWQAPLAGTCDHGASAATDTATLIRTFHGHLGPYVVLGHRMGRVALESLGAGGHFDVSARVRSVLQPPASCLIDGVQLGSGCTLGKRNIEVEATDGPAFATFTAGDGHVVTVRLKADLPARVKQMVEQMGVEAAGEALLEADVEELFEIER